MEVAYFCWSTLKTFKWVKKLEYDANLIGLMPCDGLNQFPLQWFFRFILGILRINKINFVYK